MFAKIARSWDMTKQSWAVLRKDKQLMIFPLVSSILTVIVAITFIAPPAIFLAVTQPEWIKQDHVAVPLEWRIASFAVMFAFYFVTYSIVTFFNSALIACALNSFDGQDTSAKTGMRIAMKRLPQILAWSAVNATVGVIIQALRERAGWIGEKILGLVGVAWTIATFFVVPVLVVEGVGPFSAVKRSFDILKKSWGESLVAQVGVSTVFGLITFAVVFIPLAIGGAWSIAIQSPIPILIIAPIAIIAAVILALIASTLKMILVAACYRYASTGEAPFTFEQHTLQQMFGPKKK